ncbi:hypothetical protein PybrP1_004840 [[Pythium] brassicae (nom. inval.)]|nr:hypothetical protein PybrP1_004840 [[Pythium] brassicae (nom. inval.)]
MANAATLLSEVARTPAPSPAAARPRAVKTNASSFDGGEEKYVRAQLIDNNEQMVHFTISHLRGRASVWVYSALLGDADAFVAWDEFRMKTKRQFQPSNNEVLLRGRFFALRKGHVDPGRGHHIRPVTRVCESACVPERVKHLVGLPGLVLAPDSTLEEIIHVALAEQRSHSVS